MAAAEIDMGKFEAFMGQVVDRHGRDHQRAADGDRREARAVQGDGGRGAADLREVAERTGVAERSVREWLRNQAAGGYVRMTRSQTATRFPTSTRWRWPMRTARSTCWACSS